MSDLEKLLLRVEKMLANHNAFKCTLSKPRSGCEFTNMYLELVTMQEGEKCKVIRRSKTQDFTTIIDVKEVAKTIELSLENDFFFIDVFSSIGDFTMMQSKKGKITFIEKKLKSNIEKLSSHNDKKNYLIDTNTPFLKHLGIVSQNGEVFAPMQNKFRQINKYIEVFSGFLDQLPTTLSISDMGCGKAYLTFALYHYLHVIKNIDVAIVGYELRQDLVNQCNGIAHRCGFDKLSFQQGSIDSVQLSEKNNVVIALHACDIATDMAIAKGIQSQASLILLSPCCHKQIRKAMTLKDSITQFGILEERQAEIITDTIRALILQSKAYTTNVFEFISKEHTGKNLMISAIHTGNAKDTLSQINALKQRYGIEYHYLEKLLYMK